MITDAVTPTPSAEAWKILEGATTCRSTYETGHLVSMGRESHILSAARRAGDISPSGTVAVSQKVRELRAQGIEVINIGGGDPDFPTPPHIVEAAMRSLRDGETHYVDSLGLLPLREAITEKLRRENGVLVAAGDGVIADYPLSTITASVWPLDRRPNRRQTRSEILLYTTVCKHAG